MTADRPDPARVVADADVLAADLLVGGPSRAALDQIRRHSWMSLVASDRLLDQAQAIIAGLATESLAGDWRERVTAMSIRVDHPARDHPGLASARRAGAAHLLTLDAELASAATGATLRPRLDVSVRQPDAFVRVFDPERIYRALFEDPYPGPDRDPRE